MANSGIMLTCLILLIFILVVSLMSYISVRVYDSLWVRGKEARIGILLAFVWLVTLSLSSIPMLVFVPFSNSSRIGGIAVIESLALVLAITMGFIMSRSKQPSTHTS